MTPELSGYIRHFLTGIGVMMVSLGWVSADKIESVVGMVMATLIPFVGIVVTLLPFYWSYRAKQATAEEAKKIAARVIVERVPFDNEILEAQAKR